MKNSLLFSGCLLFSVLFFSSLAESKEIVTNEARFQNPPSWLTRTKVNNAVARVQKFLEWDIRRVEVTFHSDATEFQNFHKLGSKVRAVTYKDKNQIHIGPLVDAGNFEFVFGHELTHVILWQKFKESIPKWLEEGLANFVPVKDPSMVVDYGWLAKQVIPNVKSLGHSVTANARFEYQASTALAQMIASKCSIEDLIALSVGKSFEGYLSTYCGIMDLDDSFKKWVSQNKEKVLK